METAGSSTPVLTGLGESEDRGEAVETLVVLEAGGAEPQAHPRSRTEVTTSGRRRPEANLTPYLA
jgi:hypothetical protein